MLELTLFTYLSQSVIVIVLPYHSQLAVSPNLCFGSNNLMADTRTWNCFHSVYQSRIILTYKK